MFPKLKFQQPSKTIKWLFSISMAPLLWWRIAGRQPFIFPLLRGFTGLQVTQNATRWLLSQRCPLHPPLHLPCLWVGIWGTQDWGLLIKPMNSWSAGKDGIRGAFSLKKSHVPNECKILWGTFQYRFIFFWASRLIDHKTIKLSPIQDFYWSFSICIKMVSNFRVTFHLINTDVAISTMPRVHSTIGWGWEAMQLC